MGQAGVKGRAVVRGMMEMRNTSVTILQGSLQGLRLIVLAMTVVMVMLNTPQIHCLEGFGEAWN